MRGAWHPASLDVSRREERGCNPESNRLLQRTWRPRGRRMPVHVYARNILPASRTRLLVEIVRAIPGESGLSSNNLEPVPRYKVQNRRMRIGQLATRAGVNIQTIRFYE